MSHFKGGRGEGASRRDLPPEQPIPQTTPLTTRRCLVIGGGLLGSHTAFRLADLGHETVLYSRSFSPWLLAQRASRPQLSLQRGTVDASGELQRLIGEADVVFLLAGSSTPAGADRDPAGGLSGSVALAVRVLDAMRHTGTRRVALASSGGTVYGCVRQVPTPEDHPTEPISLHGVNAVCIEQYADYFARQHGLEPVVLRFSNVYGPGQRVRADQGVLAAWCEAHAAGRPIQLMGDGAVRRDFVYATDAAEATARAALDAPIGTYNVGGGAAWSLAELLDLLHEVSGRDELVHRTPARPVDVPITHLDVSKLERACGWRPRVELPEGLRATWEWAAQASVAV